MPQFEDNALPAALSELRGEYRSEQLLLTLVYHPDPARLGESACLAPGRASRPEIVGRAHPLFGEDPAADLVVRLRLNGQLRAFDSAARRSPILRISGV